MLRQVDEDQPRLPTPSLDELDELITRTEAAGVQVRLDTDGSLDVAALPRDVDLAAYRIVQESLTNVARHAVPPTAVVRIGPTTTRSTSTCSTKVCRRDAQRLAIRRVATASPG